MANTASVSVFAYIEIFDTGVPPANGFVSITLNGTTYNYPHDQDMLSAGFTSSLESWLNGLITGVVFNVTFSPLSPNSQWLVITVECNDELNSALTNEVTIETPTESGTTESAPLNFEICIIDYCSEGNTDFAGELIINCEDLSCITFQDNTGLYPTAPNGYNNPTGVQLDEITAVTFELWNSDETVLLGSFESAYRPDGLGNSVCMTAAQLAQSAGFVQGYEYVLKYIVSTEVADYGCVTIPFTYPYCGVIPSGIGINFSITEKIGCSSIDFADTTGSYSSGSNPTGYGTPNPSYADVSNTVISILKPDGETTEITSYIPTGSNVININAATLGYSDGLIPVGIYEITYTVYTENGDIIGIKTTKVLFHCQLRNCIVNKGKALLDQNCSSKCSDDNKETDRILNLIFSYEALLIAAENNIGCIDGDAERLLKECQKDCPPC